MEQRRITVLATGEQECQRIGHRSSIAVGVEAPLAYPFQRNSLNLTTAPSSTLISIVAFEAAAGGLSGAESLSSTSIRDETRNTAAHTSRSTQDHALPDIGNVSTSTMQSDELHGPCAISNQLNTKYSAWCFLIDVSNPLTFLCLLKQSRSGMHRSHICKSASFLSEILQRSCPSLLGCRRTHAPSRCLRLRCACQHCFRDHEKEVGAGRGFSLSSSQTFVRILCECV